MISNKTKQEKHKLALQKQEICLQCCTHHKNLTIKAQSTRKTNKCRKPPKDKHWEKAAHIYRESKLKIWQMSAILRDREKCRNIWKVSNFSDLCHIYTQATTVWSFKSGNPLLWKFCEKNSHAWILVSAEGTHFIDMICTICLRNNCSLTFGNSCLILLYLISFMKIPEKFLQSWHWYLAKTNFTCKML